MTNIPQTTERGVPCGGWVTKDSGSREEMPTGSVRDSREGKGRYDLLPPLALRRIAQVYERGAKKYNARNWELGQSLSRYADSALRHLFNYLEGMRDEDHAAQAAWNVLAIIHTEEAIERDILPSELDDLPNYTQGGYPPVGVKLNGSA